MKKVLACTLLAALIIFVLTPGALAQRIKLRYADQNAETSISAQNATIPLLKSMEAATNGAVEIEMYFSETLVKTRDTWDSLRNGVADIAWLTLSQWPGRIPMTDAFGLPGLAYQRPGEYAAAMWNAYEKYPEMRLEYEKAGIRPLLFFSTETYFLVTAKKQIKVLEDLKGMKMRVLGGAATTQMIALGGSPVYIPMPDNYISFQKGVIDGLGLNGESICGFRLYELGNFITYAPLQVSYSAIAMGERKWKSLPKDVQDGLMSKGAYQGSIDYSEAFHGYFINTMFDIFEKNGRHLETYTLPPEEWGRWVEVSQPVFDEYYRYVDSKGVGEAARSMVTELLTGSL